jgi:hypothetical protein
MATRNASGFGRTTGGPDRLRPSGCFSGISFTLPPSFDGRFWEQSEGYDGTMPVQGFEDWDFWLGALERSWEFVYLPEIFLITDSSRTR